MTPGSELNLQLLQRAYCYLRLSGADEPSALRGMRASMNALADAGDGEGSEAIWRQLESLTSWIPPIEPSAPPVLRGHIAYAGNGR